MLVRRPQLYYRSVYLKLMLHCFLNEFFSMERIFINNVSNLWLPREEASPQGSPPWPHSLLALQTGNRHENMSITYSVWINSSSCWSTWLGAVRAVSESLRLQGLHEVEGGAQGSVTGRHAQDRAHQHHLPDTQAVQYGGWGVRQPCPALNRAHLYCLEKYFLRSLTCLSKSGQFRIL